MASFFEGSSPVVYGSTARVSLNHSDFHVHLVQLMRGRQPVVPFIRRDVELARDALRLERAA